MSGDVVEDDIDSAEARPILQLDARRREMLELMGVRLWWPEPKAPAAARAEPAAARGAQEAPAVLRDAPPDAAPPVPCRPAAPAAVTERQAPVRPAAPAAPVAPARAPAAASGAAEGLLADAPRLLFGNAAGTGGWLIVADLPPDMLGGYGEALAGDEGRLLANMLRALALDAGPAPVHLVRVHRGSGSQTGEGMPRPLDEVLGPDCAPLAPRVVLALGPLAAQALLRRGGPIGKLRGEPQVLPDGGPMAGTPALASYPLGYLLRSGAEKAKAWADLCQAAALASRP